MPSPGCASGSKPSRIEERALQQWSLVKKFQAVLDEVSPDVAVHPTEHDPRRTLHRRDYFSLFLLGMFNPVLSSMRALCKASSMQRTRQALGTSPVSLGSFSEAQSLFDPQLLEAVLNRLVADLPTQAATHIGGVDLACLRVVDSTLWYVLPRMDWATWRSGRSGHKQNGVRFHLKYRLADGVPVAGICAKGCGYLMRLKQNQVIVQTQHSRELSAQDLAAGVCRDEDVVLGRTARYERGPFRLIVVDHERMEEPVWLVTNQSPEQLSARAGGAALPPPLGGGGFFPLAQMPAALPALAGGERKRRGHPDLHGVDLRGAADAAAGPQAQQAAHGDAGLPPDEAGQ